MHYLLRLIIDIWPLRRRPLPGVRFAADRGRARNHCFRAPLSRQYLCGRRHAAGASLGAARVCIIARRRRGQDVRVRHAQGFGHAALCARANPADEEHALLDRRHLDRAAVRVAVQPAGMRRAGEFDGQRGCVGYETEIVGL
jgi:hypothetical protein